MKVLITGGAGFLGSHLCLHFKRGGWDVVAYDNLTKLEISRIAFGNQEKIRSYNYEFLLEQGVQIIEADIRDKDTLRRCARTCDLIINAAAQPAMTLSSEYPVEDFEVNVLGILNLLEVARQYKIPFVTCSSIHVYGTGINETLTEGKERYFRDPIAISETHPTLTGHLTPLHASKRAAEIYIQTYSDTYGLKATSFRLTGIYGPRQFGSEDHGWISLLAIKTMLGLPIQLIGNGKQVRDILYISDAVRAFSSWFRGGCPPGIYNIGGGTPNVISVLQCLEELGQLLGKKPIVIQGGHREGDLLYFACDTSKAARAFNWYPAVLPHKGLRRLVEWLKENQDIFNA